MDKNLEAMYGKPDFDKNDCILWFEHRMGICSFLHNGRLFTIEFHEEEVYKHFYGTGNKFVNKEIHATYKKWINEKFEQIVLRE
jgi:hypothetical protein